MKRLHLPHFARICLVSFALFSASTTAPAQMGSETGQTRTTSTDARDTDRDYGWLGLIGLVGLAGLLRKRDPHPTLPHTSMR